jgi:hypothetical protein
MSSLVTLWSSQSVLTGRILVAAIDGKREAGDAGAAAGPGWDGGLFPTAAGVVAGVDQTTRGLLSASRRH